MTHSAAAAAAGFLGAWDAEALHAGLKDWRLTALPGQLSPPGDWRVWLFLGGRGAGKTRAGAEWVADRVRSGAARRVALVGATLHDVREVMIDGVSGLANLGGPTPEYESSRRRLLWPCGAEAHCFSGEDPESLRGPQFDTAWADEFCYWARPEETLAALQHGLRMGARPRMMISTTPRPIAPLRRLMSAADTVVTSAPTWVNRRNLAKDFLSALNQRWDGGARARRELLGEMVEDAEGALWRRSELEALHGAEAGPFERVVVGVDPPAAFGPDAATCGIVAAGARGEGVNRSAVVLADASVQGAAPQVWAARAAELARVVGADAIVAEANNGGEMVRAVLSAAAPEIYVRLVRASEGKRARAEPIAAHYARGRVRHAAAFPALEDEMCAFGAEGFLRSPDRLDAMVWALTDLLMNGAQPRARVL